MSTEATKQQSIHYGCLVIDGQTGAVDHYVEKPSSYVSTFINCGVYVCSLDVFSRIAAVFHSRELNYNGCVSSLTITCLFVLIKNNDFIQKQYRFNGNHNRDQGYIEWERAVITPLAGTGKLFAMPVS